MTTMFGRVVHPPQLEELTNREIHPKEKYVSVDENGFLQISPETSGYDLDEGVQKVAMYVWDSDSMSWVRGMQGTVTGMAASRKKRFDQVNDTTLYIGDANSGTAETAAAWRIKRITFNASGDPIAIDFASAGAMTLSWPDRASLTYS